MKRILSLIILIWIGPCVSGLAQVPVPGLPKPYSFPIQGGSFEAKSITPLNPSAQFINQYYPGSSQKEQDRKIRAEVDNYKKERAYRDQLVADAFNELNGASSEIHYEFPANQSGQAKQFYGAFSELQKMIDGKSPLNLKKAVFLVEHAYDTTLRYDDFNRGINEAVQIVAAKMKKDKINPGDNTAKIMGLFQYMSDTISVSLPGYEKKITSYPKTYDFEDFWGKQDYSKMFVSKALRTGSGQCHSLPLLFLVLCQEIGADANLSFSPNHSFIKFKDKRGIWHNLELTNGMLASDHFMVQSGYIKAEAIQSKIFLEPVSIQRTITQCVNDLTQGYIRRYGYDSFVKACTNLSLKYYDNDLTAHQINANYFASLADFVIYQYRQRGLTKDKLEKDSRAMAIINSAVGASKKIENLGYTDMPADAYEAWLRSIQEEVNRQRHLQEIKGLNGMIQRR